MIHSMTTFARQSSQDTWGIATWEIRVVNHRYFDCVIKVPEVFRAFEANFRLKLHEKLRRGRVDCMLRFTEPEQSNQNLSLNTQLVKKLLDMVREVKSYLPMSNIDPLKILSWPEVLQTKEVDLTVAQDMVVHLFDKALAELVSTREREGTVLAQLIKDRLQEMLFIVTKIKKKMPQVVTEQRARIIKRLDEVVTNLDQSRLEQEMLYFVQKIDVAEEIDRLEAHINEVLRVLDKEAEVGKRLDFLMQELNREANTLAAKSVDIEITQAAVELKVLIEQMREQVQNIV